MFHRFGAGSAISWDSFGYYYYYRLGFIDGSWALPNLDTVQIIADRYNPSTTLYQFTHIPGHGYIIRYPIGQSIVYLPFFLLGHLMAFLGGYPTDGFSQPYEFAIRLGGLVYHTLAFALIAKLLAPFFRPRIVALTLFLLFFATNALISLIPMLAHGTLLFLIPLTILVMVRYLKSNGRLRFLVAGAVLFGLICLVRPTDAVTIIPLAFLPFAYVTDKYAPSFRAALGYYRKHLGHVALFALVVMGMGMIQFSYWKYAGGSWIIQSYGGGGEGLDLLSPHTLPFLAGFKTGWFIYTPIMIAVVVALIYKAWKGDYVMRTILVYLLVFVYLASSWTNYWYGSAYSQRAMLQTYALLAFPMAALLQYAFRKKPQARIAAGLLVIFTGLNWWQATQFINGVWTGDTVTAKYYFASFTDLYPDPEKEKYRSINRYAYEMDMPSEVPDGYERVAVHRVLGDTVPEMEGVYFSKAFKMPFEVLCPSDHCWLRFVAASNDMFPHDMMVVFTFEHKGVTYGYRPFNLGEIAVEADATGGYYAESLYLTPRMRRDDDELSFYIWNRRAAPGNITGLTLEVYAPKKQ